MRPTSTSSPSHPLWVLDFDGVVAPTSPFVMGHYVPEFFRSVRQIMAERGAAVPSESELQHTLQTHIKATGCLQTALATGFGLSSEWIEHTYVSLPLQSAEVAKTYLSPAPGLKRLLLELKKQGHTLTILTQSHRNHVRICLEAMDMADLFTDADVFDRTHTPGRTKRDPHPYQHLLQSHRPSPATRIFMVEDSPANLPAARESGLECILVGPHHTEESAAHHSFATLEDALQAHLSGQF